MLGGADNPNGELPSYITGADRCRVEIRPPCRAPVLCGNPPTLSGRRCRVGIRPPCRAPVLCGNPPTLSGRRSRVGIRPPCRAPVPCGNPPTLPGAGAVWESAHLAGRRCRVGIRPPCRAPVLCGNSPIFMTKICQMTGSCVLIYVRRDFAYQLLRTEIFLNHQYYT